MAGLNAEQRWKTTTVAGWARVKKPHTVPKHHQILDTEMVPWLESPQWKWPE